MTAAELATDEEDRAAEASPRCSIVATNLLLMVISSQNRCSTLDTPSLQGIPETMAVSVGEALALYNLTAVQVKRAVSVH